MDRFYFRRESNGSAICIQTSINYAYTRANLLSQRPESVSLSLSDQLFSSVFLKPHPILNRVPTKNTPSRLWDWKRDKKIWCVHTCIPLLPPLTWSKLHFRSFFNPNHQSNYRLGFSVLLPPVAYYYVLNSTPDASSLSFSFSNCCHLNCHRRRSTRRKWGKFRPNLKDLSLFLPLRSLWNSYFSVNR